MEFVLKPLDKMKINGIFLQQDYEATVEYNVEVVQKKIERILKSWS